MTIRDITLGIIIMLWLYWTYKSVKWSILNRKNNTLFPFYVTAWWLFCIVIPLAGLIVTGMGYVMGEIINNWNTVVI